MPRGSSENLAILERRKTVATSWLRGFLQWEIARDLSVSLRTVSADINAVKTVYFPGSGQAGPD